MSLERRFDSKLISKASYDIFLDSAYAWASAEADILYLFGVLVSVGLDGVTGGLVSEELLRDWLLREWPNVSRLRDKSMAKAGWVKSFKQGT